MFRYPRFVGESIVEPEVHDVSIAHFILLPFDPELPGFPHLLFAAVVEQVVAMVHLGFDKPLLEVSMDDSCGLWRLVPRVECPCAVLIASGGEERPQSQSPVSRVYELVESRLLQPHGFQEFRAIFRRIERRNLRFDLSADHHGRGMFGLCYGPHGPDKIVLFADSILVHVADVDHRLEGDQVQVVDQFQFFLAEAEAPGGNTVTQYLTEFFQDRQHGGDLLRRFLVQARHLGSLLVAFVHRLEIGQSQFYVYGLYIAGRVDPVVDVDDIRILETADHMDQDSDLADRGQEAVSQPLALRGTRDQTGDINEFDCSRDNPFGGNQFDDPVEPLVRYADHADIRIDGAERIICRFGRCRGER